MTTTDVSTMRAGRYRVPRSRGAMSGVLLVALGAWAALVPFFGPYLNLAYTPAPNDAWHWTAARGWLEVLPGAAAAVGGLVLIASVSRVLAMLGGWLAAAAGAWLVVGAPLAHTMKINLGTPDPSSSTGVQALESLLFFFAVGAAIVLFAALALGRLSVLGVRDVQAAERRLAAEQAATEAAVPTAYPSEPDEVGRHGTPDGSAAPHGDPLVPGDTARDGQPGYQPGYAEPTYAHTATPPEEDGR